MSGQDQANPIPSQPTPRLSWGGNLGHEYLLSDPCSGQSGTRTTERLNLCYSNHWKLHSLLMPLLCARKWIWCFPSVCPCHRDHPCHDVLFSQKLWHDKQGIRMCPLSFQPGEWDCATYALWIKRASHISGGFTGHWIQITKWSWPAWRRSWSSSF